MQNAVNLKYSLADSEKWGAVAACDKSYDGMFFYGVKTTGIFCRPFCTAKKPLRENVQFFDAADDAIDSGFRPCKKCRPDLLSYEPMREVVEKAKEAFGLSFDDPQKLKSPVGQLGVSPNHLARLFKQNEGCTHGQYLAKLRINKASELLRETDMNILQIALCCGFESLSNFYKRFKEHSGVTPAQYRSMGGTRQ